MSLRKKSLFVALEGVEEKSTVSLEAIALEAEEEMVEMRDEHEDISTDINSVEEAAEDSETLEKIKDTMEESVEEGEGVSEDAAEIAEVAIESIYDRLGLDTSKVMPAMESFGSSSSRVTATKIALEGIKETITKIWTAIKEFFKNIWNKIKMFFAKIGLRRDKIESYIKEVRKSSKDLTSSMEKKEDEISSKSLAKKFSLSGNADYDTATSIEETAFKVYGSLDNLGKELSNFFKNEFKDGVPKNVSKTNKKKNKNKKTDENNEVIDKLLESLKKSFNFVNIIEDTDEKTVIEIAPLLNNSKLKITLFGDYKVTTELTEVDDKPAEKLKALDQQQISSILDKALSHIKASKDYEKQVKILEEVNKTSTKIADEVIKLASKLDESEDEELTEKLDAGKKVLSSINLLVSKFSSVAPIQFYSAAKGLADYAKVSIRNYEKKES